MLASGWALCLKKQDRRLPLVDRRDRFVVASRRLETLYAVWQQVFAAYLFGQSELQRLVDGKTGRREAPQHNVVYYRTRDEYNQALRANPGLSANTIKPGQTIIIP